MRDKQSKEVVGKSLGRLVSGVGILTTLHKDQPGAMLSSWFQQASFDPPMITVAVKIGRPFSELMRGSGKFVLNILHTGQKNILAHFGKGFEPGQNPFKGIATKTQTTGVPILKEALCFLECELRNVYPTGDHYLYVGEVVGGGTEEEGAPMVHIRRSGFNY